MKHLLYLLLAASLLTEQPLYGAPKKNKKIKKKGKKIVKKRSAKTSASGVSTSTPTTPTPAQTIKTEATMTKQKAQKLMEAYLEKYRKNVFLPMTDMMSKIEQNSHKEKLRELVKERQEELQTIDQEINKNIQALMTIFNDKNGIEIAKSNNLKDEFKKIVELIKKNFSEKIKANKTEEQNVIKNLDNKINDKFKEVLKKSQSEGKVLNEEIVKLKKEKEAIEKNYPQIVQTILNIHNAALSLIENDILKDFFGEISKEESAKKSSEKKKAYYDVKETKYKEKITKAKEERKAEQKKDREEAIKILKEKINKETNEAEKTKLQKELKMMQESKELPDGFKYTEKSDKKEKSETVHQKKIIKDDLMESQKKFNKKLSKKDSEKKNIDLLDI